MSLKDQQNKRLADFFIWLYSQGQKSLFPDFFSYQEIIISNQLFGQTNLKSFYTLLSKRLIHNNNDQMADSIKIAVRARPLNEKEIDEGAKNIVEMDGQETRLKNPQTGEVKKFGFHRCYYSTDDTMGHPPVNNSFLFNDIGKEILDHIYQGYNSTVFAYGQTGAGKSYSIEGGQEEKGLLQMILKEIFERKKEKGLNLKVWITYMEIYNQSIRDLQNTKNKDLKVQMTQNSVTIPGLQFVAYESYEEVLRAFQEGKKVRIVRSHAMNSRSSRSHAIFTIKLSLCEGNKKIQSKLNIVDLAGSERQSKTGATGLRLVEANSINLSLTCLGLVIEALAKNCEKRQKNFVPLRNSVLTQILSESLKGNSKTLMIAAISPASTNFDESMGTLRFAQRASLISTHSKKNVIEEKNIKAYQAQIQRLKRELEIAKNNRIVETRIEVIRETREPVQSMVQSCTKAISSMEQQKDEFKEHITQMNEQVQTRTKEVARNENQREEHTRQKKKQVLQAEQQGKQNRCGRYEHGIDAPLKETDYLRQSGCEDLSLVDRTNKRLASPVSQQKRKTMVQQKQSGISGGSIVAKSQKVGYYQKRINQLEEEIKIILKSKYQAEANVAELSQLITKLQQTVARLNRASNNQQEQRVNQINAEIALITVELKIKAHKEVLERLRKERMERDRKKMLEEAGISQQSNVNERKFPYIMNVSEDPTLLGVLLYDIKEGETRIGNKDTEDNNIKLNGLGIIPRHCIIINEKDRIFIQPNPEAKVFVNGSITTKRTELHHLDRITLGHDNSFKLIIPGKGAADNLRDSMSGVSKYGEYLDDKLSENTIQAKSMKRFLKELEQRLDRSIFIKFLSKFKAIFKDVGEANIHSFLRYRKFPLKSKNVYYRINLLLDIEYYMQGIPELIILCEHKETKEVLYVWTEEKFQSRFAQMQKWIQDTEPIQDSSSYEFDPWFQASETFIRQKTQLENMERRKIFQFYSQKLKQNEVYFRQTVAQKNMILQQLQSMNISEELAEQYNDFYFRDFPSCQAKKAQIEKLRQNEQVHLKMSRLMETFAQIQRAKMDHEYYLKQKAKYGQKDKSQSSLNESTVVSKREEILEKENVKLKEEIELVSKREQMLDKDNVMLNEQIEQLHDQIKQMAKQLRRNGRR